MNSRRPVNSTIGRLRPFNGEKEMNKSIVFECPKLNGTAHLLATFSGSFSDETSESYRTKFQHLECDRKHDCGIAKRISHGWSYDWTLCPAHESLNSKGSL
jgi:hypothetical protein